MTKPTFFKTPAHLRKWLEKNHEATTELLVGFYKVGTGKQSITWPQLVEEVLCFGWIDGVRKGIDEDSYTIRITPRKPRSNWSSINIKLMNRLIAEGRVAAAGLAAWERRDEKRSEIYSYERKNATLSPSDIKTFKADKKAWDNFEKMPPGYRRTVAHLVASAKTEETRQRRLAQLMDYSRRGERIPMLTPLAKPKKPKA